MDTNAQLAHNWGNQTSNSRENNSTSFYGTKLYSYSTIIGQIYNDFTLITNYYYSSTTSCKHYPARNRAITHHTVIEVSEPISGDMKREEIAELILIDSKLAFKKLSRARTSIGFYLSELSRLQSSLNLLDVKINHVDYQDLIDFDPDNYSEQIKIYKDREKVREQAKKAKQQELLADWRLCNHSQSLLALPVALRIRADNIETSHGARVPLVDAIQLIADIKQGKDLIGNRIGGFTINKLDEKSITIGCHNIALKEAFNLI